MTRSVKLKAIIVLLLLILILFAYILLNPGYAKQLKDLGYDEEQIEEIKDLDLINETIENSDSSLYRYALDQGVLTKENYTNYILKDEELPQNYSTEDTYSALSNLLKQGYSFDEAKKVMDTFDPETAARLAEEVKPENLDLVILSTEKGYTLDLIIDTINSGHSEYLEADIDVDIIRPLAEKGYSMDEIQKINQNLNDDLLEVINGMKYIENLGDYLAQDDFNFDLLPRYIIAVRNNNKSIADAVKWVNNNEDYIADTDLNWSAMYNDELAEEVADPNSLLVLVNKTHTLPADYVPEDLTYLPEGYYGNYHPMREEAANALIAFSDASKAMGYGRIYGQSNYRSYAHQESLYNRYVVNNGQAAADRYSARAGYSEHQTGLVSDLGGGNYDMLDFNIYPGYKWALENAHKYGFIQRYPEGKEFITGYEFESWHFRYVGVDAATTMYEHNWTLEEYLMLYGD